MININISNPDDGLGDKLRNAFFKVNTNFDELVYTDLDLYNKIDSKVQQTISQGVTYSAPSQNLVYNALSTKVGYIISDAGPNMPISVTISNTNTIMKSYYIPANTFTEYDIMNIESYRIEKTGTAGTATMRIYINSTPNISGGTIIATYTLGGTNTTIKMNRSFSLRDGLLRGIVFGTSVITDNSASTAAIGSTAYIVTNPYYLIATIQPVSTTDSFLLSEFMVTS